MELHVERMFSTCPFPGSPSPKRLSPVLCVSVSGLGRYVCNGVMLRIFFSTLFANWCAISHGLEWNFAVV